MVRCVLTGPASHPPLCCIRILCQAPTLKAEVLAAAAAVLGHPVPVITVQPFILDVVSIN